jgi:hypothetical protein
MIILLLIYNVYQPFSVKQMFECLNYKQHSSIDAVTKW